jgi:hypothetical protein
MDTSIVVALIGVVGSATVAVLSQLLAGRIKAQESKIAKLCALSMSEDGFGQLKKLSTGKYCAAKHRVPQALDKGVAIHGL